MGRVRKDYRNKELAELVKAVSNKLKLFREDEGLSQNELAKRAGVSKTTVNDIENGVATDIRFSTVCGLAKVLKKRPVDFFTPSDLCLCDPDRKEYIEAFEQLAELYQVFDRTYRRLK